MAYDMPYAVIALFLALTSYAFGEPTTPKEIVSFPSGKTTLQGEFYRPKGKGPFPAILYNHGSAPGMLSSQASETLGPLFASKGWIFFMPYRRGQGLSESAGTYIMDQIDIARKKGGKPSSVSTMVRLLTTDHLQDQMAALEWLRKNPSVRANQVAAMGNSFGGIETVLGMREAPYCAGIDAAGAAQSWADSKELRNVMIDAVKNSQGPIFFIQAENDYDLSPSRELFLEMKNAGKTMKIKIYPPFGKNAREGHAFAYQGSEVWFKDGFSFLKMHCLRK